MKIPLTILAVLLLNSTVKATDKVVIELITKPIYHAWEDAPVRFVAIPYVGWDLDLRKTSVYYSFSFGTVRGRESVTTKDINLISIYKIKVSGNYVNKPVGNFIFNIDTEKAVKPVGYNFTIAEVSQMAAKAISIDNPDRKKVTININGKLAELEQKKVNSADE